MLSFELNSVAFNFPIHVVFYVCVAYAMGFALLRCVLCYIQALIRNWLHTIISNIMIVDGGGAGVVVVAMSSLSPWTICYQINILLLSTLLFTSMRFNVQCSLCRVKSWKHKHPPIKFNVRKFPIFQQQNRNFSFNFHTYTDTHTLTYTRSTWKLCDFNCQMMNIFSFFSNQRNTSHTHRQSVDNIYLIVHTFHPQITSICALFCWLLFGCFLFGIKSSLHSLTHTHTYLFDSEINKNHLIHKLTSPNSSHWRVSQKKGAELGRNRERESERELQCYRKKKNTLIL